MKKFVVLLLSLLLLTGCANAVPGSAQPGNGSVTESVYSKQELRSIAYAHAGVNEADVYDLEEDWESGNTVYELDFEVRGREYEYRLDAATGEILYFSKTPDKPDRETTQSAEGTTGEAGQQISKEEAQRIALEHAGLNQGAVKNLRVEYDREDNHYDVEFIVKRMEYEYEIDASTGKILKAEKDN